MQNSGRKPTNQILIRSLVMKNFILLLLPFLSVACSVSRQVTPREQTTVEVREKSVFVTDTVYVELPRIVERVQTLDTTSVIENKYAKSAASVSGGVLAHSFELKPVREPKTVQKEIVYKDSVIVKEVNVDHYIKVPAGLSGWQKFKIKLGGYAFALIIILIVVAILYVMFHSKIKLL